MSVSSHVYTLNIPAARLLVDVAAAAAATRLWQIVAAELIRPGNTAASSGTRISCLFSVHPTPPLSEQRPLYPSRPPPRACTRTEHNIFYVYYLPVATTRLEELTTRALFSTLLDHPIDEAICALSVDCQLRSSKSHDCIVTCCRIAWNTGSRRS